jgi:hypothetical protein
MCLRVVVFAVIAVRAFQLYPIRTARPLSLGWHLLLSLLLLGTSSSFSCRTILMVRSRHVVTVLPLDASQLKHTAVYPLPL